MRILMNNAIKGYKIFKLTSFGNLQCRDFIFSEDKVNVVRGSIVACETGFHFCEKIEDCFMYYPFLKKKDACGIITEYAVCEVQGYGLYDKHDDKYAVSNLVINRRLSLKEVYSLLGFSEKEKTRKEVCYLGHVLVKPCVYSIKYNMQERIDLPSGNYLCEIETPSLSYRSFSSYNKNIRDVWRRKEKITKVLYKAITI